MEHEEHGEYKKHGDQDKKILRAKARLLRQAAFSWDQDHGGGAKLQARDAFLQRYPLAAPVVVAGYVARESELDPMPLLAALQAQGICVALPVVAQKGAPLVFRVWDPCVALVEGPYGIPVPPDDALTVAPDFLVVPLLAYDSARNRLGYGGGYYDRTLAHLRQMKKITAVGFAYEAQALPAVPVTPRDQVLDDVVAVSLPFAFCGVAG